MTRKAVTPNSLRSREDITSLDHGSDPHFLAYYEKESLSEATLQRFRTIRDKALGLLAARGRDVTRLRVADIGCGAGTQSMLWAQHGHSVLGLDVNAPLIEVARRRAAELGLRVDFRVGTATDLPLDNCSVDVCLLPELLEHVPDWKACLHEASRSIGAGGLLYLSTTNTLCPVQSEFELPLYSWFPGFAKRYCERLAVTTRPSLANYAKYPAVNWFTFYRLREYLAPLGFECYDRFDMIDLSRVRGSLRWVIRLIRILAPARFVGHVLTPGTTLFAVKTGAEAA
ncbi:MAG TPA: class I SAM-dependent methyltransferase [Burkholderiaceae bacterium]|nr:class I SAM-dependent methyltransferase [Burkholderiaceae bacterium]